MLSSASRRLFQAQPAGVKMADHYRVLIIGAGAGGLAVASHLRLNHRAQLQPTTTTTTTAATTTTDPSIALIDPSDYHYYQPLWTLVGGGVKSFLESRRLMADLVKSLGLPTLIKQSVLKVDPHSKQVQLNDNRKVPKFKFKLYFNSFKY
jgi:sulfide:quinone oxidoreductase